MTRRPLLLATLLAAGSGCGHAAASLAVRAVPPVDWPEAPAAPRARLAAVFPDPEAGTAGRAWWRSALDAVVGVEREGKAPDALVRPFGVAAAADGSFVVADPDAPRVLRVGADGRGRDVVCRGVDWGAPLAVALGADGTLWVADAGAAVVVRVDASGRCGVLAKGSLERPTGIAASHDRLYVVDPPRHEVVVLSTAGDVVARWGSRGAGAGELSFPTGIALDGAGAVLVVDALNFRIARFSADGRWLGAFGAAGDSGGDFARPKAVAVDHAGRVYVSDAQRELVLVFSPDGTFEYAVGAPGDGPGRFGLPAGVAVGARRLVVADSLNRRVQVFELLGERA